MHQAADRKTHDIVKVTLNGLYSYNTNPLLDSIGTCFVIGFIIVYIVTDLFL